MLDVAEIRRRSQTVDALVEKNVLSAELREILRDMGDLERIAGKISLKSAMPRDLVSLRSSAEKIPLVIGLLDSLDTPLAASVRDMDDLSYVANAIALVLVDSPPAGIKDGGIIREGYREELDELRSISTRGKEWIAGTEAKEKELTGIPNLRVG